MESLYQRKVGTENAVGGQEVFGHGYNRQAGGLKTVIGHGLLIPLGSITAAKAMSDMGKNVAFYNDGTATVWIKFGDATVTAAAGGADGIPVPPKAVVTYAAGANTHVIASGACFAYEIDDDSYLAKNQR